MPLTPTNPAVYQSLPMFDRGAASTAALYNLIAQKALDSVEANRNIRIALESQITGLEGRLNTVSPNFSTLLANANSLRSTVDNSIVNNTSSGTALDSIQNNLVTSDQNATIQSNRIAPLTALIDSLTIGEEIQGFSDILLRIANATRLASRILGTNASGEIVWREPGSIGSGVILQIAFLERQLADNVAGGTVASLRNWNTVDLSVPTINNIVGFNWNNTTKQATIPTGEYITMGFIVGCSNGFQCRLREVSNNAILALGTPAKSTTATAISNEPINNLSRFQSAFFLNNSTVVDLQSWYDTAAPIATNTQGVAGGIPAYTPQQAAWVLIRVVY